MNAPAETIDTGLVSRWLGLAPGPWPPDHYALLGLPPGTSDVGRIEQHVHERLARVRCYQISHPAAATEAMNRLAQAFLCLSDSATRRAYDATLNGAAWPAACPRKPAVTIQVAALKRLPAPPRPAPPPTDTSVSSSSSTQVDWQSVPPPVRQAPPAPNPQPAPEAPTQEPPSSGDSFKAVPYSAPADLYMDVAHHSCAAQRGLGTLACFYDRIVATRQLLQTWTRAGRYLGRPKRQLMKPSEEADLTNQLAAIDDLLPTFPKILGRPGQPGYRVAAMGRLESGALIFRAMDPIQRDALAKDWRAGQLLLLSHQRYLRQELKKLKRRGWIGQALWAVGAQLRDHFFWVMLALILIGVATIVLLVF